MIAVAFGVASLGLTAFYVYRRFWCHRYFKRNDIPGPEPHFFFGNLHEIWNGDRHLVLQQWSKRYGKIFGFYEGSRPVLVVSDLMAVKSICVEQSKIFSGRLFVPFQPDSEREPDSSMMSILIASGRHWRIPRTAASPFFADANLKTLMASFEKKAAILLEVIGGPAERGQPFDIRDPLQHYAMEVFGATAFGIEMDLQRPQLAATAKSRVYEETTRLFSNVIIEPPKFLIYALALNEIAPIVKLLSNFFMRFSWGYLSPLFYLTEMLKPCIEERRQRAGVVPSSRALGQRKELIQLLMDKTAFRLDPETRGRCFDADNAKIMLNEGELVTNLVAFLMAGYETTSTTLAYAIYSLALHPQVQDKLYEEICRNDQKMAAKELDYNWLVNDMPYLDWVCKETIRLYPEAVHIVSRMTRADTVVCGVPVPKAPGSVLVDVWSIHNDWEHWGPVDPALFHPERFEHGRSEHAFLGFGAGPHQCIGMRFAMLEIKLTLVRILSQFRLLPADDNAPTRLPVRCTHIMVPANAEIPIRLVRRR